jgi:NADH-ubiquinone oxidoreductase chain 4
MILAAVLLKLRAYGFYRILFFLRGLIGKVHWLISSLIYGAVVRRVIALRQTDIKSLVAYSSISHMGIIIAGLVCFSSISSMGTFIILLSHGFCSSALFYLVNFHYERSYSRQILLSSGQINFFSHMAI